MDREELAPGALGFVLIATGHDDARALGRECAGHVETQPVIGAGDERGPAGLVRHVVKVPVWLRRHSSILERFSHS